MRNALCRKILKYPNDCLTSILFAVVGLSIAIRRLLAGTILTLAANAIAYKLIAAWLRANEIGKGIAVVIAVFVLVVLGFALNSGFN